jgi:hypothetical protein
MARTFSTAPAGKKAHDGLIATKRKELQAKRDELQVMRSRAVGLDGLDAQVVAKSEETAKLTSKMENMMADCWHRAQAARTELDKLRTERDGAAFAAKRSRRLEKDIAELEGELKGGD